MTDRLLALEARKANLEQMAEPESMPSTSEAGQGVSPARGAIGGGIERFHHPPRSDGRAPRADERRGDVRAELYGELGAILALGQGGEKTNRHSLIIAI